MEAAPEILSALLNVAYVVGMLRQRIWAWPAGLLGCLIGAWVMYQGALYAEVVLYLIYSAMAVYGWVTWSRLQNQSKSFVVKVFQGRRPWYFAMASGSVIAVTIGYVMSEWTDNPRPYVDSAVFSFSVIATLWQIHKRLESWYLWIVINAVGVWLYLDRDLIYYMAYSVILFAMSVRGLREWRMMLALTAKF